MDSEKSLLSELLQLVQDKQIPYTPTQLKKMSQEKLEEVKHDYELKELDTFNETLVDVAVVKIEEYSKSLNLIKQDSKLAQKLQDRKLFRRDLKTAISYITPFLPYVGLLEGAVVYGIEIFEKFAEKSAEKFSHDNKNSQDNDHPSQTAQGDQQDTTSSKTDSHTYQM